MLQYLLSGIELHIDKGFGITADSYYKSAEHLYKDPYEYFNLTQQAEMPQSFLYRHSIELYLKSLIIIFHKQLNINYGTVQANSDDPEILIGNKWQKLYTCHYIDKLYFYWLNSLLIPNIERLNKVASQGDWQVNEEISDSIKTICKYDLDSSYFRYPITKNASMDTHKYSMKKIKTKDIVSIVKDIKKENPTSGNSLTMLYYDDNDNLVDAYTKRSNILLVVRNAMKEVAHYFHCIHIMSRATLCNGM